MKKTCSKEAAVSKAAFTDVWDESLKTHVAGCAFCEEIVQVSRWMLSLGQSFGVNRGLPDPTLLWRRAGLSLSQSHEGSHPRNYRDD
jgi:hypothetical protein